jgi:hypothetical protein
MGRDFDWAKFEREIKERERSAGEPVAPMKVDGPQKSLRRAIAQTSWLTPQGAYRTAQIEPITVGMEVDDVR